MLREINWIRYLIENENSFEEVTSREFEYRLNKNTILDIGLNLTKPVNIERFFEQD